MGQPADLTCHIFFDRVNTKEYNVLDTRDKHLFSFPRKIRLQTNGQQRALKARYFNRVGVHEGLDKRGAVFRAATKI